MSSIAIVVEADGQPDAVSLALGRLLRPDAPVPERIALQGMTMVFQRSIVDSEGEGGPPVARSADGRLLLALDGRAVNRDDLLAVLGRTPEARLSDAEVFLLAYERWGDGALERIEGSFAVAILDGRDESVLLARDPIGDKTLFYWADGGRLVAASEEVGVLAHPAVPQDVDRLRLAALFGMAIPESGATFFRHVKEIPPAHALTFRRGRLSVSRYWEPGRLEGPRFRTDDEWAEAFVDRLDRSVARCLPSSGRAGVLLSGGLDSCPIAALAARQLSPARLTSISWVFDELLDCDERRYVEEVAELLGLERLFVRSDDLWPLSDFGTWPTDPNRPEHDAYRRLMIRGQHSAREAGVSVVLTGFAGDHLYTGAGDWLIHLLREGRSREALSGFSRATREIGCYRALRSLFVSPLVPHWLRRRPEPKPWLTPYGRELLRSGSLPERAPPGRQRRRQVLLSEWTASCAAKEVRHASGAGIDLRFPFRDKGVLELALALPSHQLERGWTSRPVVRRGFRHLLPESVVTRPLKTSFRPLSDRGMFGPGRKALMGLLSGKDHLWAEFVDPAWVAKALQTPGKPESEEVTIWYCAFVDLWSRRVLELRA